MRPRRSQYKPNRIVVASIAVCCCFALYALFLKVFLFRMDRFLFLGSTINWTIRMGSISKIRSRCGFCRLSKQLIFRWRHSCSQIHNSFSIRFPVWFSLWNPKFQEKTDFQVENGSHRSFASTSWYLWIPWTSILCHPEQQRVQCLGWSSPQLLLFVHIARSSTNCSKTSFGCLSFTRSFLWRRRFPSISPWSLRGSGWFSGKNLIFFAYPLFKRNILSFKKNSIKSLCFMKKQNTK